MRFILSTITLTLTLALTLTLITPLMGFRPNPNPNPNHNPSPNAVCSYAATIGAYLLTATPTGADVASLEGRFEQAIEDAV